MAPKPELISNVPSPDTWLSTAANKKIATLFAAKNLSFPDNIFYVPGFTDAGKPAKGKLGKRVAYFDGSASSDGRPSIIILRHTVDPVAVLMLLIEGLMYPATGMTGRPDKHYRHWMRELGAVGNPSAGYHPSVGLDGKLKEFANDLGDPPWGRLDWTIGAVNKPEKQSTRMHKVQCPAFECPFNTRLVKSLIENPLYGPGSCPRHHQTLVVADPVKKPPKTGGASTSVPPANDADRQPEAENPEAPPRNLPEAAD